MKRCWVVVGLCGLLLGPIVEAQSQEKNAACLACHDDPTLTTSLSSGESLVLHVDPQQFAGSVHGAQLSCTDCHDVALESHPSGTVAFATRRQYALAMYENCKRCHFSNYTKLLESVHYDMLAQGALHAPVCVDCHGAHDVERPAADRQGISRRCATCHHTIYATYATSVHGAALLGDNNQDVPVCTDCHTAHNIQDPRSAQFHLESPEVCGRCHANAPLMAKYGLSTDVLRTYLNDFHGVSVQLHRQEGAPESTAVTAGCIDCHGVHNISRADAPNSTVMKTNLVQQCRRCHPEASEHFPDAWLSHYEPTPTKAPLVYAVKLFYRIFIPFIIGGLALHILLHIWRAIVNR
ncbi:MAG: cytochrome c3 family protein [Deltaproteobacteria bacterium]|nr:cytochrome c3 family protein [Deltaproteobacteria bacterium]